MAELQSTLAGYQARDFFPTRPNGVSWGGLVLRVVDADAVGLKTLASAITATPGLAVVLVSASSPRAGRGRANRRTPALRAMTPSQC